MASLLYERALLASSLLAATLSGAGCSESPALDSSTEGTSGSTSGSAGSDSSSTGFDSADDNSSSSGSNSESGSEESTSAIRCTPGDVVECYWGPDETRDVGVCQAGEATCTPGGVFGPCEGSVEPSSEDCTTPEDEDCDGATLACSGVPIWQAIVTGLDEDGSFGEDGEEAILVESAEAFHDIVFSTDAPDFSPAPDVSVDGEGRRMVWVRYSEDGEFTFARVVGTDPASWFTLTSAALDSSGHLVLAGDAGFGSELSLGGMSVQPSQSWVARLDSGGDPLWIREVPRVDFSQPLPAQPYCSGNSSSDPAVDLALRPSDDAIAISADFRGPAPMAALPFPDGESSFSECNNYVAVFSSDGTPEVARTIGGSHEPESGGGVRKLRVAFGSDDTLILAGLQNSFSVEDPQPWLIDGAGDSSLLATMSPSGQLATVAAIDQENAFFTETFAGPDGTAWWFRRAQGLVNELELRSLATGEIVAQRSFPYEDVSVHADASGTASVALSFSTPLDLGLGKLLPTFGATNRAFATFAVDGEVLLVSGVRPLALPGQDGWRTQHRLTDSGQVFVRIRGPVAGLDIGLGVPEGGVRGQSDTLLVALQE